DRLSSALRAGVARNERRLLQTTGRLSPAPLHRRLDQRQARLEALSVRLDGVMPRRLERAEDRLAALSRALTTLNPKTPKPGFARIEDADGAMIASAAALSPGQAVQIVFGDGAKGATIDGEGATPRPTLAPKPMPRPKAPPAGQGDLF
ncbi:MAG: exodeoxyribonuclease VII large subunit, partial [Proteobacteria bacterium]|nr:exodeoxyribonuclease VII large subunit [Pseudomonadota bacterium]